MSNTITYKDYILSLLEKSNVDEDDILSILDSDDSNDVKSIKISKILGEIETFMNVDGGVPGSVYTSDQVIDAGGV